MASSSGEISWGHRQPSMLEIEQNQATVEFLTKVENKEVNHAGVSSIKPRGAG